MPTSPSSLSEVAAPAVNGPPPPGPAEQKASAPGSPSSVASPSEVFLLVAALMLAFFSIVGVLITFWPSVGTHAGGPSPLAFAGVHLTLVGNEEGRSFVLVLAAGALGAFVHAASSAGDFIGSDKLKSRWLAWYLLRMPIGASLALLLYFLLRGGVLTGGQVSVPDGQPPYGIIGLSALAGMFSGPATAKLAEVFDTLFRLRSEDPRTDKLDSDKPVLKEIVPKTLLADGSKAATITLIGDDFTRGSRVVFADQTTRRAPKFISASRLELELEPSDLAHPGELRIAVESAGERPVMSDWASFTVQRPPGGGGDPSTPEAPKDV